MCCARSILQPQISGVFWRLWGNVRRDTASCSPGRPAPAEPRSPNPSRAPSWTPVKRPRNNHNTLHIPILYMKGSLYVWLLTIINTLDLMTAYTTTTVYVRTCIGFTDLDHGSFHGCIRLLILVQDGCCAERHALHSIAVHSHACKFRLQNEFNVHVHVA